MILFACIQMDKYMDLMQYLPSLDIAWFKTSQACTRQGQPIEQAKTLCINMLPGSALHLAWAPCNFWSNNWGVLQFEIPVIFSQTTLYETPKKVNRHLLHLYLILLTTEVLRLLLNHPMHIPMLYHFF